MCDLPPSTHAHTHTHTCMLTNERTNTPMQCFSDAKRQEFKALHDKHLSELQKAREAAGGSNTGATQEREELRPEVAKVPQKKQEKKKLPARRHRKAAEAVSGGAEGVPVCLLGSRLM